MKQKLPKSLKIRKIHRLTAGLTDHEHPTISPDGRMIAFYAGEYGSIQIYLVNRRGRFARRISPAGGNSTQPAWHPSGLRLAYRHQHSTDSKWEIWETGLVTDTEPRMLLADPAWHYKHPCYDLHGEKMAYFSDEGSPDIYHLWLLDVKSGGKTQLTFGDTQNHCHPVFSPDGKRIVFHAYEGTDITKTPPVTNLYELEIASGEVRALSAGGDQLKHPFYLNDSAITYHHEDNATGKRWLSLMDLPTGKERALTNGKNNDKHPFPWMDRKGRMFIAWASKKLGEELPGEVNTYDIFLGRIESLKKKSSGKDKRLKLVLKATKKKRKKLMKNTKRGQKR